MTDLVEWLTSVWDEQAEDAQRAIDLTVDSYPADRYNIWWRWARAYELRASGAGGFTTASGAPSPTEVLARIAADRKILRLHGGMAGGGAHECPDGFLDGAQTEPHTGWEVECETLRLMASAYADREGYREEWAV